jgi:short subunit dehydrogenase-like uncharacterized protein
MIDACLTSRAHYLDITGEIDVFLAVQRRQADAQAAGIVICPGVGFDVIPTDCMPRCSTRRCLTQPTSYSQSTREDP